LELRHGGDERRRGAVVRVSAWSWLRAVLVAVALTSGVAGLAAATVPEPSPEPPGTSREPDLPAAPEGLPGQPDAPRVLPSVVPTMPPGQLDRPGPVEPARPALDTAGMSLPTWPFVIGGLVLVGAVAFIAGAWVGRRRVPAAPTVSGSPPAVPPRDAAGEVHELVLGLIGSHDLAGDDASRHHVEQTLRRAGVVALSPPPGSAVDARRHEVVAVAATDDPAKVGLVVEVLRPGWARGPAVLRPAQVRVLTNRAG
jgi:hypothetical protein